MKTAAHSEGLLGYTFYSRKVQVFERPEEHPAYNDRLDYCENANALSLLIFALRDDHGSTTALVQVFRSRTNPFGVKGDETAFLDYFYRKFSALYPVIAHPTRAIDGEMIKLLQFMDIQEFLLVFQKQMEAIFHCRRAEIWRYDQTEKELFVYKKTRTRAEWATCGIVGEAITRLYPISCLSNRTMSSYNVEADGVETEPVLAVPVSNIRTNITTAVVLRGGVPVYTHRDQELLVRVADYVVLAINNLEAAAKVASVQSGEASERKCLETMTKIIDLVQDKANLADIITEAVESMEVMTHSDRSSLFAVDHGTSTLHTLFSTGNDYPKVIQSNRAVPARVFTFGQVINLADAYENIEFDATIDLETGYRTRSVLAVPMMNSRSEVIGCAEFLNRTDSTPFLNSDVPFLRSILTFLGTAIDADRLKREIVTSTQELRSFLAVGMSFMSGLAMQSFLVDIMKNMRLKMQCKSVVIYLLTTDQSKLKLFLAEGVRLQSFLPMSHHIGALSFKTKEVIIATDATSDPRFIKDPFDDSGVTIRTIVIVPIINHNGDVFGVVEAANKSEAFSGQEINAVKSFGALIALTLDNRDLEGVSDYGNVEFEMDRWIDPLERGAVQIPQRLSLLTAEWMDVNELKFEASQWTKVEMFKVIYYIFSSGGLLTEFKIQAETMFSFIYSVRESYLDIPHHNWVHAIDVLHFVHMLATYCKLESHITKIDLLCLYIAALCQDAGHQGYSPAVLAQNEFSSELLNRGQSAESARHCAMVVNILAMRENNILKNVPGDKLRTAWDLILRLITGTDMSNHFSVLKSAKEITTLDWKDYGNMVIGLTLILKLATIGFMYKDGETCDSHLANVRAELELEEPVDREEGLFGPTPEIPPAIRRKKEILAFTQLIAGPLINTASSLLDGLGQLFTNCQAHVTEWMLDLYPPQEESTSIVIQT
jgi:GAF domain-containing protein